MKKYIVPACEVLKMEVESVIANSLGVHEGGTSSDDTIENEDEFLTKKMHPIWGNEGIWE